MDTKTILSLGIGLVVQAAGIVWWASKLQSEVQHNDFQIQMIAKEGVVYKAPKAGIPPFTLMSKEEFMPVKGDKVMKKRMKMEDEYKESHGMDDGPIIMISVMDTGEDYGLA